LNKVGKSKSKKEKGTKKTITI
jgi:hypothetical protein